MFATAQHICEPRWSTTSELLRDAISREIKWSQRPSDGTILFEGVCFEIPGRCLHFRQAAARYFRSVLVRVDLDDDRCGAILAPIYSRNAVPLLSAALRHGAKTTLANRPAFDEFNLIAREPEAAEAVGRLLDAERQLRESIKVIAANVRTLGLRSAAGNPGRNRSPTPCGRWFRKPPARRPS